MTFLKIFDIISLENEREIKTMAIKISDTIKETNYELRIALIKEIFKNGYNYICKASECDYFVHNDELLSCVSSSISSLLTII